MLLPFNWGIPIAVWISLVTAAIGFLGVYMAAHPPTTEQTRQKWFYKGAFVILAVFIVALTWRQSSNDDQEKSRMFLSTSNQLATARGNFETFKISSSNQVAEIQKTFDDYKKLHEIPVPDLPQIIVETLPGLPEGFTNDTHIRLNRLSIRNYSEVEIENFCSRIQLPEPIFMTLETNQPPGTSIVWRPLMDRIVIKGTGGRNWIGGGSKITWVDAQPCFNPTNQQGEKLSISHDGDTTGIWELTIDRLPPRGYLSILFATSNDERAANYLTFQTGDFFQPTNSKSKPNQIDFLFEGKYQYQAIAKPGTQYFFMPILFDSKERETSSMPVRPDFGNWRANYLVFQ